MAFHTRKPSLLGYDMYFTWLKEVLLPWLEEHSGDSNFPTHIVGDLSDLTVKITDYGSKIAPYKTLIQLAHDRNKLYTTAADKVYDKLKQIKMALLSVAEDPDILATFGLSGELPDDRHDLFTTAEFVLTHWATVSADPDFAPLVSDFDALQVLFDDFAAKRTNYYATDSDRATAQNELLAAREAVHEIERDVFGWYRSRWPDGKDEAWTDSPWGCTGGGEEPSVPIPDWPGPGAFEGNYLGEKTVELIYGPVKDATHCDIEWKDRNAPNEDYIVLFNDITMDPKKITNMRQLNVDKGKYTYRLVPFKDEEKGMVTEIEIDVKD